MEGDTRGVLYPVRLPSMHRLPPSPDVAALVRWFWVPEWDLPVGRVSRQEVLAFPACNLVVEPGGVGLAGPTTRRSTRDLSGRGWAVGALLRPAAVPHLVDDPGRLRDGYEPVDARALHDSIARAMTASGPGASRRAAAVSAFSDWLTERIPAPDADGVLANAMVELIDEDVTVVRVEQVAERLGVSVRTVQRLARRFVGLTPVAMIRRRRLQEAADLLRSDPSLRVADVAATLGYADQAHLAADFRTVLGFTPTAYRAESHSPSIVEPARDDRT
jgi:AraC-like DNA-binding protein